MTANLVETEQHGPVGLIRLNAPEKLNAMSHAMGARLLAAVNATIPVSRALILTGAGRGFCTGAALEGDPAPAQARDLGLPLEQLINPLMLALRASPIPWISAVRGPAAGVGASLALAADLVVASETASFIQAFTKVGLVPDGGAGYLLTRAIGRVRAMEMALLAEPLPAARALEWGLVNRVVPDAALEETAMALAQRLAEGPALALKLTRASLWAAQEESWESTLTRERHYQDLAGRHADFDEGIAAFKARRKPRFGA